MGELVSMTELTYLLYFISLASYFEFTSATKYFSEDDRLELELLPDDYQNSPPFAMNYQYLPCSNAIDCHKPAGTVIYLNEELITNGAFVDVSSSPVVARGRSFFIPRFDNRQKWELRNLTTFDFMKREKTRPIVAYFTLGTRLKMNCRRELERNKSSEQSFALHWKGPQGRNITSLQERRNGTNQYITLIIETLTVQDAGLYSCIDYNTIGDKEQSMIAIEILVVQSENDVKFVNGPEQAEYFSDEGGNITINFEHQNTLLGKSSVIYGNKNGVSAICDEGRMALCILIKQSREQSNESFRSLLRSILTAQCESRLFDYNSTVLYCKMQVTFFDLHYEYNKSGRISIDDSSKEWTFNVKVRPNILTTDLWVQEISATSVTDQNKRRPIVNGRWAFLEFNRDYKTICVLRSPLYDNGPVVVLRRKILLASFNSSSIGNFANHSVGWEKVANFDSGAAMDGTDITNQRTETIVAYQCLSLDNNSLAISGTEKLLNVTVTDLIDTKYNGLMDIIEWAQEEQEDKGVPKLNLEARRKVEADEFTGYETDHLLLACRVQKIAFNEKERLAFYWIWIPLSSFPEETLIRMEQNTTRFDDGLLSIILLNLTNISKDQAGKYLCINPSYRYENSSGLRKSVTVTVQRPVAPYYESSQDYPAEMYDMAFGEPFHISCRAKGTPKPTIRWLKNGLNYTFDIETLSFPSVAEEHAGRYSCLASTKYASVQKNTVLNVTGVPIKSISIVIICVILALALGLIGLGALFFRGFKQRKQLIELNRELKAFASYNAGFEIPKDLLIVDHGSRLGEGQFGIVYRGTLKSHAVISDEVRSVAVKVPKDGKNPFHQSMLLDEMKIMVTTGKHINVLSLIGACTCDMVKGELFVIVELCSLDSLDKYLIAQCSAMEFSKEPDTNLDQNGYVEAKSSFSAFSPVETKFDEHGYAQWTAKNDAIYTGGEPSHSMNEGEVLLENSASLPTKESSSNLLPLLSFSFQIANGMDYLQRKLLIHRDLAARNLLLTTAENDQIIVKIADYGLARQQSSYRLADRSDDEAPQFLPVAWMAPESVNNGHYTLKSDVWSFGVVLWEIFTLGENPVNAYDKLLHEHDPGRFCQHLFNFLQKDGRLPKPSLSSNGIFQLINDCWKMNSDLRPTFSICRERIRSEMTILASADDCNRLLHVFDIEGSQSEQSSSALQSQERSFISNKKEANVDGVNTEDRVTSKDKLELTYLSFN